MKTVLACLAALATVLLPLPAGAGEASVCNVGPITSQAPAGALIAAVRRVATAGWLPQGQPEAGPDQANAANAEGVLSPAALASRVARYAEAVTGQRPASEPLIAAPDCAGPPTT